MRTAWRQPALLFFLLSSLMLAILVVWWGVFFLRRVNDLEQGAIHAAQVEALEWALAADPGPLPPGLERIPKAEASASEHAFQVILPGSPHEVVVLSPSAETAIHASYERRRVMILGEGSLLLALVIISLGAVAASQSKALRLNWEMTNFLQAATHELKSPLASLRLLLETLKDQPAALGDPAPMLEAGLVQIQRLERLIANMLQTSALDARRLRLHLEPLELGREVRIWAKAREADVTAREGSLTLDCPNPIVARFDRGALQLVLDNLLDNALKYSPGVPVISVELRGEEAEAVLSLSDQGIGLQAADVPRVFDRFWRAGDELTRTSEGTGLGLYLVRKLVTMAGGRVQAASPGPQQGTTITLRLPRRTFDDLVPTRDLIPAG